MCEASVLSDFKLHIATAKEKKVVGGPAIFLAPAHHLSIYCLLYSLNN